MMSATSTEAINLKQTPQTPHTPPHTQLSSSEWKLIGRYRAHLVICGCYSDKVHCGAPLYRCCVARHTLLTDHLERRHGHTLAPRSPLYPLRLLREWMVCCTLNINGCTLNMKGILRPSQLGSLWKTRPSLLANARHLPSNANVHWTCVIGHVDGCCAAVGGCSLCGCTCTQP